MSVLQRIFLYLAMLMALLIPSQGIAAEVGLYPHTIQALQARYADEIQAHQKYGAYAEKARAEGYPNIGYLFTSLATAETIHARNFKRLLSELGVEVDKSPRFEFEVEKTKHNIKHATEVEMNEIAHEYPRILEGIKAEQYQDAIKYITYAWLAEKQHRKLLLKIQTAATKWFGLLAAHIENQPTRFYVCEICGSTLMERPADQCPIGDHPASHYYEVPGFPGIPEPEEED